MKNKMFDVMDTACEAASKATGVSIRFPRPSKRAWRVSAVINSLVGVGFLLVRISSLHKWALLPGALGLAGGIITWNQGTASEK